MTYGVLNERVLMRCGMPVGRMGAGIVKIFFFFSKKAELGETLLNYSSCVIVGEAIYMGLVGFTSCVIFKNSMIWIIEDIGIFGTRTFLG